MGVDPDALVNLVARKAAAQGDANRACRFCEDSGTADAGDVHALADVTGEDDLVLARVQVCHTRDVAAAHQAAIRLDDGPEVADTTTFHPVHGRLVLHWNGTRLRRGARPWCVTLPSSYPPPSA